MRELPRLLIALLVASLLAACSTQDFHFYYGPDNTLAPDFGLRTVSGSAVVPLSSQRGHPVLINFWASWCGPCRAEMHDLQSAYMSYQNQGLVVLSVNNGETPTTVAGFVRDAGLSFPVLLDGDGAVSQMYKVHALPTTVFVDADGAIRHTKVGSMAAAEIDRLLASSLGLKKP